MEIKHFINDGIPVPKARPKFSVNWVTRRITTYTDTKTKKAEEEIRSAWLEKYGGEDATEEKVVLCCKFYLQTPKSYSKKKQKELEGKPHDHRPDVDNLIKTVMDGLNGTAYLDDSQVVSVIASKYYSMSPRTEVSLWLRAD